MGGLPCAKVLLDSIAYIGGTAKCFEQSVWLRLEKGAPELTDAEMNAARELLRQAEKKIEEAGKLVGKPFSY